MFRRRPKFFTALLASALVALLAVTLAVPAAAQPGNGKGHKKQFGAHDQTLIQAARARGEGSVTVIIAAEKGQSDAVANGILALGGTIQKRLDDISYIRASVPIDKINAVGDLGAIQAADIDEVIPLDDPRPDGAQAVAPQPPPGAGTPNINPYMPIGDTNAAQFRAAHPTWDGRGVTIGILDTGVDLDHPALQTGKDINGVVGTKVVSWTTATDPITDGDPSWVRMATTVTTLTFTLTLSQGPGCGPSQSTTFTVPAPGTYRFGRAREYLTGLGGELGKDFNRDGDHCDYFGILLDQATGTIWVDTNQDHKFADETPMRAYSLNHDVNHFGTPGVFGANGEQKALPFVVESVIADEGAIFGPPFGLMPYVNIGIVSGAHGSHVAGITSATSLFGGNMTGAAPAAKLFSVRVCLFEAGCTSHALIEGMAFAASSGQVDVINMSIGGLPALNDGNNARATLYNNLIDTYNVQIFISAGNSGAGLNTIGDPSVASRVVSVGSYISQATWRSNYGSDSAYVDNIHPFSSRGPREDGGFKPNIIAPGAAISTVPTWQAGQPVGGTYALPAGYAMFNGTSMASPQAAGGAALLISASKQYGNEHAAAQLRQAINSSARFLPRYGAYEQGNGLMNVSAAWELLKANIQTVNFTGSVPVNSLLSGFLATPGVGEGIFEREGVFVGGSYQRDYTFVRTSGPAKSINYNVSWVGNDGTFNSAAALPMKLNTPNKLTVVVKPKTAGIHSAILNIDDPSTPGIDFQVMNTVVVADGFSAPNYSVVKTGNAERNQSVSFFFAVPTGVPAFKVDLSGPSNLAGTGQVRFLRFHPYGVGIDSNSSLANYCPSPSAPTVACSASSLSRTTSNPQAGVWEVTVEARRTSDTASAPFTLTASILGATVSPNPDIIASATLGLPVARSYTLTNLFGAFTGRAVGTPLSSAFRATPTIANLAQQKYTVTVTAGSTSLRATIGGTSDPAADLDLFVYNCIAGNPVTLVGCALAGQSAGGSSEESVTIPNPAAGTWVVLIDGFAVPAGTTTYNYVDVFANPAFGSVSVTDANALRPAGSSWVVPGSVTANAVPAAGRVLLGNVQVRTDSLPLPGILIGQGEVVVQSVTP